MCTIAGEGDIMEFIYNKDRDVFIHVPTKFIIAGEYLEFAHNDEIKRKLRNLTGHDVTDYGIGMLRSRRNEQTVYS
jgi:hypothetical protein